MLNRFRFLKHSCLRFNRKLSFLKQQQRSGSQRLYERCVIEERSSLQYVSKTSSPNSNRQSLIKRLELEFTLYTKPQSESFNSVQILSSLLTLNSHSHAYFVGTSFIFKVCYRSLRILFLVVFLEFIHTNIQVIKLNFALTNFNFIQIS